MKNLILFFSLLLLVSCEDVIDVDLDTEAPRLVIDANINWEKGTSGNVQTINLSTSTGFYNNEIPKVTGATVFVTNTSNTTFTFSEEMNPIASTGRYTCNNFIPIIGETYYLTVIYNGQSYSANEKLLATPEIIDIEQKNDLGINSDEIGIKVNFNDFPSQENFYLSKFKSAFNVFPIYEVLKDEFSEGNKISTLYTHPDLETGSNIDISLFGISKSYYNYMNVLLLNTNVGGIFGTPPVKIKGNIINETNPDNYALGYFRLGEIENRTYTVE